MRSGDLPGADRPHRSLRGASCLARAAHREAAPSKPVLHGVARCGAVPRSWCTRPAHAPPLSRTQTATKLTTTWPKVQCCCVPTRKSNTLTAYQALPPSAYALARSDHKRGRGVSRARARGWLTGRIWARAGPNIRGKPS